MTNAKNKRVPILQAYANTKYAGKVVLKFDSNGDLVSIDGSPTLLNHEIKQGYNNIYVYFIYNFTQSCVILNLKQNILIQCRSGNVDCGRPMETTGN